jgi:hypothetical protein
VTGKDRTDRCKMWTDIDLKCTLEEPPPCSFTPESFIKTWMNRHGVEMVPLGMSESDLTVISAGTQIPDSFAHPLRSCQAKEASTWFAMEERRCRSAHRWARLDEMYRRRREAADALL